MRPIDLGTGLGSDKTWHAHVLVCGWHALGDRAGVVYLVLAHSVGLHIHISIAVTGAPPPFVRH